MNDKVMWGLHVGGVEHNMPALVQWGGCDMRKVLGIILKNSYRIIVFAFFLYVQAFELGFSGGR